MSYIRVLLRGAIGTAEVWSVGPAYNETTNVTGWDQGQGQAAADAVAAVAVPAPLMSIVGSATTGTTVRVERRSDAGILLGAAEANWAGFTGAKGITRCPPQTSIVLSLRSNVPGSRGRGRLYWPALGANVVSATGRLEAPSASSLAGAARSYLDLIETALKEQLAGSPSLIDYHLAVVSPTTGGRTDITRIQVGDVLDTQRRRRDRLPEAYAVVAYP